MLLTGMTLVTQSVTACGEPTPAHERVSAGSHTVALAPDIRDVHKQFAIIDCSTGPQSVLRTTYLKILGALCMRKRSKHFACHAPMQ